MSTSGSRTEELLRKECKRIQNGGVTLSLEEEPCNGG